MNKAIELICKERLDQINKHGRSLAYDRANNPQQELRVGAIALLKGRDGDFKLGHFPLNWDPGLCDHMVSKSYLDRMVTAAALLVAEIDMELSKLEYQAKIDEESNDSSGGDGSSDGN